MIPAPTRESASRAAPGLGFFKNRVPPAIRQVTGIESLLHPFCERVAISPRKRYFSSAQTASKASNAPIFLPSGTRARWEMELHRCGSRAWSSLRSGSISKRLERSGSVLDHINGRLFA